MRWDLIYSNAERVPGRRRPDKIPLSVNHNVSSPTARLSRSCGSCSDAKICGMIAATPTYPETCCPDDVNFALRCNDYLSYFHASVLCERQYPAIMVNYLTKHGWMPGIPRRRRGNPVQYGRLPRVQLLPEPDGQGAGLRQQLPPAAVAGKGGIKNPYVKYNEWGWAKDAVGLRTLMHEMYYRFGKRSLSLKTASAAAKSCREDGSLIQDDERIEYHKNHIIQMKKAIEEDGVECLGYVTWGPD